MVPKMSARLYVIGAAIGLREQLFRIESMAEAQAIFAASLEAREVEAVA